MQLDVAVEEERFEILDHPVMKELIVQKWKSFARGYFLIYFFQYLAFLVTWSILLAHPAVQEKHSYKFPKDIWRVLLGVSHDLSDLDLVLCHSSMCLS